MVAPSLNGSKVLIRQLDSSVFDDYWRLLHDEEVARWTGPSQSLTESKVLYWLQTRVEKDDRFDWAIFDSSTAAFAGEIVLNELDAENRSMNVRVALLTEFQNRGLGSEAMQLVCEYALESLKLGEITLGVMVENLRAQRSYKKCGFVPGEQYVEDGIASRDVAEAHGLDHDHATQVWFPRKCEMPPRREAFLLWRLGGSNPECRIAIRDSGLQARDRQ